jgi:excinuclease ABC subunit C
MPALTGSGRNGGHLSDRRAGRKPLAADNGHRAVALRDHVKEHCEDRPGVYRMMDEAGAVLYVGKSIKLRTRLLSYFRADRSDKATEIISAARGIEWEHRPSEFAAMLLELRQIQQYRPWFNVQHKLERSVCFIRITREAAPRVLLATGVREDGSLYYGPYRGREMVRGVLRELCDLLQLRDCSPSTPLRFADQLDLFALELAPGCVRADLGKCLGPCAARCTRTTYLERVAEARRFLEGTVERPLHVLRERMEHAAGRMQFEYAAALRDRALRLEGARAELVALRNSMEALTLVYSVPGYRGDDRVYLIRRACLCGELPMPRNEADQRRLLENALPVLQRRERARKLDETTVSEMLLVSRWFRLRPDELSHTLTPEQCAARLGR